MKRYIILLILLLAAVAFPQAKVGTAEGQFLEIGVSARATGMGETFTATANDVSAIYYNPGGLGLLKRKEAMFSHIAYIADINYEWGAIAAPVPWTGGVAGLSISSLSTGEMYETTPSHPEGTGRTFTANDFAAGLTYSQVLTDRFSAGVTWKFIAESYADVSATTWAVDVGTMYRTQFHDWRIGMAITNFGPDITFIQAPAPLPMAFHLAVAGEVIESDMHKLTTSLEISHPNDALEKFNVGAEYWWNKKVALRAGLKAQGDDAGSFAEIPGTGIHLIHYSFGGGVDIPVYLYNIKVDYSFTDRGWFDPVHRFTFGMEF